MKEKKKKKKKSTVLVLVLVLFVCRLARFLLLPQRAIRRVIRLSIPPGGIFSLVRAVHLRVAPLQLSASSIVSRLNFVLIVRRRRPAAFLLLPQRAIPRVIRRSIPPGGIFPLVRAVHLRVVGFASSVRISTFSFFPAYFFFFLRSLIKF